MNIENFKLLNTKPRPVLIHIRIPELLVDVEVECLIRQARLATQGIIQGGVVIFIPENPI